MVVTFTPSTTVSGATLRGKQFHHPFIIMTPMQTAHHSGKWILKKEYAWAYTMMKAMLDFVRWKITNKNRTLTEQSRKKKKKRGVFFKRSSNSLSDSQKGLEARRQLPIKTVQYVV